MPKKKGTLNRIDQQITLSDQRQLAYAEYGDATGYPILYFHGSQSSRLEMHYDLDFAIKHQLRIITIDRLGHGGSDFDPKATILSFAKDVDQLTSHLSIPHYSVVGMSAGAPFALGVAHSFPSKVKKGALVSGFAPYNSTNKKHLSKEVRSMLSLAKTFPFLLKVMLRFQAKMLKKNPQKALAGFLKIMSEPDQAILKNPKVMEVIEAMFVTTFEQGHLGVAHEISKILVQPWGFELNEIPVPFTCWQGQKDNNVPYQWAELMHKQITPSTLRLLPDEGHLLIFNHAEEIFLPLAQH